MMKEIYKTYLNTGNSLDISVDADRYSNLSLAQKKRMIIRDINNAIGHNCVNAVKFIRKD